ncbi:MAG TPA: OmpA family protein [Vicinamibacterales bacterium]|nr:OmpA family protein [Vicinamibacterales bacterium]
MRKGSIAVLGIVGGLFAGTAIAQPPPNPSQTSDTAQPDRVPIFRVTVVGRTAPAINYRPRRGETKIDFAGTPLLPQAKGKATISGEKGYIRIDAKFDDLQPATRFGPEYLTYVAWAITPEGRATNLGELQIKHDSGDLNVTTELQAFGLIVTAEPYFAVTQPSDAVVLENVVRDRTVGNIEVIDAKYELLKRGSYLMNQDSGRLKVKAFEPGAPLDLAEARNAVALARIAGADRYASDTFDKADRLLTQAETARKKHRGGDAIMMPARQAAQTAEDARLIAIQRMEEEYAAQQRAVMADRESAAIARARTEEERRRQAENDRQAAERVKAEAERSRTAAELDKQAADAARVEAERAKAAAERSKSEAERAADRLAEERRAAEDARKAAETARAAAEAQAQQAQSTAAQAQQTAAQAEREKAELREQLRQQLNVILETRETARGLIVNLSDVLFDTASANLKPGAREKLAKIAGIVMAHPGLEMAVEGHTDSVGSASYNQQLSERRADSVRSYLVGQGIAPSAVATSGFGEEQPVASNSTAAGRQQNRRVELIVSGEPIGRRR